jgi:dienelactone hydrolase
VGRSDAPPTDVLALASEMSAAGADWQLHAYGNTMHAFTAPGADLPDKGIRYNADAARRAALATRHFFEEVFG